MFEVWDVPEWMWKLPKDWEERYKGNPALIKAIRRRAELDERISTLLRFMEGKQLGFPRDWAKVVQFMKYMRDELLEDHKDMEISFCDFVALFHHLTG